MGGESPPPFIMEILHKPHEITQEAIDAAFVDEIKRNFKEEKHLESKRSDIARKEATEERGKTHPVLGKCVATIPARDYFSCLLYTSPSPRD